MEELFKKFQQVLDLLKSNYGPKGLDLYDPIANQKRKATNIDQIDIGPNKNIKQYGSKLTDAKTSAKYDKKSKKNPVKVFSAEELAQINAKLDKGDKGDSDRVSDHMLTSKPDSTEEHDIKTKLRETKDEAKYDFIARAIKVNKDKQVKKEELTFCKNGQWSLKGEEPKSLIGENDADPIRQLQAEAKYNIVADEKAKEATSVKKAEMENFEPLSKGSWKTTTEGSTTNVTHPEFGTISLAQKGSNFQVSHNGKLISTHDNHLDAIRATANRAKSYTKYIKY